MLELSPRKRFEISDYGEPYRPAERPEPWFRLLEELSSNLEACGPCDHRLYVTEEAMRQLRGHICWGADVADNRVEQGGLLLGHSYVDASALVVYGVVSHTIPSRSALGSGAHLKMEHAAWKEMLESAEELRGQHPQLGLQIIGWYHTHPNSLPVFMSPTDRETQARLFSHDWQFAVVLNPHQKTWRAFYGAGAAECPGIVVADAEGVPPGHEGLAGAAVVSGPATTLTEGEESAGDEAGEGVRWLYWGDGTAALTGGAGDRRTATLLLVALCLLLLLVLMQAVGLYLQFRALAQST